MFVRFTQTGNRFCERWREQGRSSAPVSGLKSECLSLGDGPGRAGLPAAWPSWSPPARLGSVAGARAAVSRSDTKGARSALWGVPPLYLVRLTADGSDVEKKRWAPPNGVGGKEKPTSGCESAIGAGAKSLSMWMRAGSVPPSPASTPMRRRGGGYTGYAPATGVLGLPSLPLG